MNHLALASTPHSSSSVDSFTPVHSAQDDKPCSAWTLAWIGLGENKGALLPPHSTKAGREVSG